MKQTPLSELSQEQLKLKEKTLKAAIGVLSGMLLVLFAVTGYLTYIKGFSVFTVLPFVFLPIFLINIMNLKKVRSEITSRNA